MQKKHRKRTLNFLAVFLFFLSVNACAQDANNGLREIGIEFNSLDNFGLAFKKSLKNGKYLAVNGSLNINYNPNQKQDDIMQETMSFFTELSASLEKRVLIGDKIYFAHGMGLGLNIGNQSLKREVIDFINERETKSFSLALNPFYKIAFQYHFANFFYMEASIKPGLRLMYNRQYNLFVQEFDTIENINHIISARANFNTSSAKIGFFYRFIKNKK